MGGTFKKIVFSDRDSDFPSRRKLTKIEGAENTYDVSRYEGTVRNEGTAWNAKTMTEFQTNIDNMFPVSIENGGTGATTSSQARLNLGLNITTGSFADNSFGVYSTSYYDRRIALFTGYTMIAKYYRISNLVICNMYLHHLKPVTGADGYLMIGQLPFINSSGIDVPATIGEFSIYNENNTTDRTIKASGILRNNERFIRIYKDDGGIAYPTNLWFNSQYQNTLDATLSVIYTTE